MPDDPNSHNEPMLGGSAQFNALHRRALAFIEASLGKPIALDHIASAAGMSRHHFTRSFKEAVGMTPMRYLWSRRIRMSKAMLLGTDTSIIDVSHLCGFASQSHFTTMFRKSTGKTPAVWRREERCDPTLVKCPVDGRVCPVI